VVISLKTDTISYINGLSANLISYYNCHNIICFAMLFQIDMHMPTFAADVDNPQSWIHKIFLAYTCQMVYKTRGYEYVADSVTRQKRKCYLTHTLDKNKIKMVVYYA
jgi:hypothetical protein